MSLYDTLKEAYLDGFKARSLQHLAQWALDHNRFLTAQRALATSTEILHRYHLRSKFGVYTASVLYFLDPRYNCFQRGLKEADRRYQMTQQNRSIIESGK